MSAYSLIPLSPTEKLAKTHAILSVTGFLVLLPVGALIARYGRNFTRQYVPVIMFIPSIFTYGLSFSWFWAHMIFQLFIAGPIIFAGWSQGHQVHDMLKFPHSGTHKSIGVTLMILYIAQLIIGLFIHYVKIPSLFKGHRPPQNYIHVLLGIAIIALAAYEVSYFGVRSFHAYDRFDILSLGALRLVYRMVTVRGPTHHAFVG
jgi:Eukaryotic cytochrome b561